MLADMFKTKFKNRIQGQDSMSRISEFLKSYRHKHNLSQAEFSKMLKIDKGNYARIELDKFSLPLKLIKKLYRALNEDEKHELQLAIKEDVISNAVKELSKILDDLNEVK